MREVEVLIAGAGPAGSTCAFELQKAGRSLLYNRFGMAMVKLISHSRHLTERILNHYLR